MDALRRTLAEENATTELTLVAHSLGTLLAAYYAARHPQEVKRLVLFGTPVYANEREARKQIRAMSSLAAAFSLWCPLARESCQLMCALRPVLSGLVTVLRRDLPPAVARDGIQHYWRSFDGTMRHVLLGARVEEALRRLPASAEVVLVHGTRDTVTPLARVRALAASIGGTVVELQGGHGDYLRHAATIASFVVAGIPRKATVPGSDCQARSVDPATA